MRRLLGFTGLLGVLVLALAASPVSAGSPALTVATGSFTFVGGHGANRTEAFTVQESSDGTTRGQVQLISFSGNVIHGNINCFTREGNQAIVGGTFTSFSGDPQFIGVPFAFAIQ